MSKKHICKVCKIEKSGKTFTAWDNSFFFYVMNVDVPLKF